MPVQATPVQTSPGLPAVVRLTGSWTAIAAFLIVRRLLILLFVLLLLLLLLSSGASCPLTSLLRAHRCQAVARHGVCATEGCYGLDRIDCLEVKVK